MSPKRAHLWAVLLSLAAFGPARSDSFEERFGAMPHVRGTIYVQLCQTSLCKMFYGNNGEMVHTVPTQFKDYDECNTIMTLTAEWVIDGEYQYRIECK